MIATILREHLRILADIARWTALTLPLGAVVGSLCAAFLWSLEVATNLRFEQPWLVWLLPAAGALVALLYEFFGSHAAGGNNLIMDEIHEPGAGAGRVPVRMGPLVFAGSVITHLCGGSAGREGTAVQLGGSVASLYRRAIPARFHGGTAAGARTLLMSGVAAGFGGVFGTPLAGAVFALEVPSLGRMSYAAAIPCLVASVAADRACAWWGIHHTRYPQLDALPPDAAALALGAGGALLVKVALVGVSSGLVSRLFADGTHALADAFRRAFAQPVWRPVAGGALVLALMVATGTRDYLGLGVTSPDPAAVTIVSAFHDGGAHPWSWLWKLVFTAVTLGASFKGGEVTPLFYIGATLGNSLAALLAMPVPLAAALGFAAVFAGATNTPLACTFLAVELFGPGNALLFAVACFASYACSGHSGIYLSQRIGTPKVASPSGRDHASLRAAREDRRGTAARGTPSPGTGPSAELAQQHAERDGDRGGA